MAYAGIHTMETHSELSSVALILIDVINDFDFPEADQLLAHARPMAQNIARLKQRAKEHKIPVIYANDNFGRWQSDFRAQVDYCLRGSSRGNAIVDLLRPETDDYFVLKPKHSGFFSTTLDLLLKNLGVKVLILTGVATNICVLFTANDAYMRDYQLVVPYDCVAANTEEDHHQGLNQMAKVLKADIRSSSVLNWNDLRDLTTTHGKSGVLACELPKECSHRLD
jgi:nicotinamidase-related amidase